MRHTKEELAQNLAERWCWEVVHRDDPRVARRLYRQQEVDGGYRLDDGAVLDDCFHFLGQIGVMALLAEVHGTAMQREMVPDVPYVWRYGLKTLFGIERLNALPARLCSDAALMQRVGFKAQHVRQGVCHRGAATRQGERTPGPISPETLANNLVKLKLRDLAFVFNGAIRALAKAGVFSKQVTGMADGTDLETTERDTGCGQVTRQVRLEDTWGKVHEIEVTVYGWNVFLVIDAVTKMPWAVNVGQIQAPEALWARALVTQARLNLAGDARLSQVVFDQGCLDGTTRWWLDQHGLRFVVPANTNVAVTADARAQAAAGQDLTGGRRVHTVRHGQGRTAWTERVETEVVGMTGLTTYDHYGTPEHARQANRRDVQANLINAVVVRTWQGKDDGPGGKTVFLTNAPVEQPLQPFDAYDDRRRIEPGWIKDATPQGDLGHPPQQPARAGRVPVVWTLRLVALATAYRLPWAREATGGEPVGWQRWRRQRWEQTRDHVIVCAQGDDGILHRAESSRLVGVTLQDRPLGIGTRQNVLATYGRMTRHGSLCRNLRKFILPHPAHSSWSNDQYAQCIATWLTHPPKAMAVYQDLLCWASHPGGDEHA
jgi:hypothetical protein